MKKNLSILFCLSFCSTVLHPAKDNSNFYKKQAAQLQKYLFPETNINEKSSTSNPTILIKIVEVVKALTNHQKTIKQNDLHAELNALFTRVTTDFKDDAINAEIKDAQQNILKSAETLINIAHNEQTDITAKNFAQKLLQPCYQAIVKDDLKGGIFTPKKLELKNITSDTSEKLEFLKHQTVDVLNRIFILWRISELLLNIPTTKKFALTWPNADLTIKEWQDLTEKAGNEIWDSTEQVKNAQLEAKKLVAAEHKSREAVTSEKEKEIKHLKELEKTEKSIGDAYTKNLKEHEEGLKKIKAAHEESLKKIKSKSEELSKEQKMKALTLELKEKYPTKADADKAIVEFEKQIKTLYVVREDNQRAKQKEALEEKIKTLKAIDYSIDPLAAERLWKKEKEAKDLLEIKELLALEELERAMIFAEAEKEAKAQEIPEFSWWERIKLYLKDKFTSKTKTKKSFNWTEVI